MSSPSRAFASVARENPWSRFGPPATACLFLLLFYWRALNSWFYQDDFGWLHLGIEKHSSSVSDFLSLLFSPKAHGNIRPWSENLFFWGLPHVFGINPLPFHIVIFATVMASLFLLYAIVRKLTGSALAAGAVLFFWLANPGVGPSLCWASIYNETQYTFFILLALWLFMEDRYWMQVAVFIIGLGSLETAVMYPCIASLYAWLFDRSKLGRTLPLYLISAVFTAVHFWAAPAVKTGPYAIQVDARIFSTLRTYIEMALGPERLGHFNWTWPALLITSGTIVMCVGVFAAALAAGRAGVFGAGWFLILLVPLLVLPEHVFEFYLTGPAIGLAIVLGAALVSRWRVPAIAFGAIYLMLALPAAWQVTTWYYQRTLLSRDLILGVVAYDRAHPGKTLLLTGMGTDQFFAAFVNVPFGLFGMDNVRLAPGADSRIENGGDVAPLYVPKNARALLDANQAVVLDVTRGAGIRDVTGNYLSK